MRGKGFAFYDEGVRVPLIVKDPTGGWTQAAEARPHAAGRERGPGGADADARDRRRRLARRLRRTRRSPAAPTSPRILQRPDGAAAGRTSRTRPTSPARARPCRPRSRSPRAVPHHRGAHAARQDRPLRVLEGRHARRSTSRSRSSTRPTTTHAGAGGSRSTTSTTSAARARADKALVRRLGKLLDQAMADEIQQPLPPALQPVQHAGVHGLVLAAAGRVHPGHRTLAAPGHAPVRPLGDRARPARHRGRGDPGLLGHSLNITDSQMAVLSGHFTMMLVVTAPEGTDVDVVARGARAHPRAPVARRALAEPARRGGGRRRLRAVAHRHRLRRRPPGDRARRLGAPRGPRGQRHRPRDARWSARAARRPLRDGARGGAARGHGPGGAAGDARRGRAEQGVDVTVRPLEPDVMWSARSSATRTLRSSRWRGRSGRGRGDRARGGGSRRHDGLVRALRRAGGDAAGGDGADGRRRRHGAQEGDGANGRLVLVNPRDRLGRPAPRSGARAASASPS